MRRQHGSDRAGPRIILALLLVLVAIGAASLRSLRRGEASLGKEWVERPIAAGQVHRYSLRLLSGYYLRASLEQRGVDVTLRLLGPGQEVLETRDAPTTPYGPESLSWLTAHSGVFTLEVQALEDARAGVYAIRLEERRPFRLADQNRIRGERRFSAAGPDHWRNTRGALRRAQRAYHEALRCFQLTGAVRDEAYALLNLGEVDSDQDSPRTGLQHLERALELFNGLGDRNGEAETLASTGYIYDLLGEKQRALNFFRRSLAIRRKLGDLPGEAFNAYQIASLYGELGDGDAERRYYQRALKASRDGGDTRAQGFILTAMARLEQEENPEAARHYLLEAMEVHRTTRDPAGEARVQERLGALESDAGRYAAALDLYNQALASMVTLGSRRDEARLLHAKGELKARRGALALADSLFRQALALGEETGDGVMQLVVRHSLASVARRRGDLMAAKGQAEAALAHLEELRLGVADDGLRRSFLAVGRPYYELAVDVQMALEQRYPDRGHLAEALRLSELARARSLVDILQESRSRIRAPGTGPLLQQQREIDSELAQLAEQLDRGQDPAVASADFDVQERISELMTLRRENQAEMLLLSPRYADLVQPQILGLEGIRELLNEDTALLEIAMAEERSYLWLITSSELRSWTLPGRAVLEQHARQLIEQLSARNRRLRFETADERRKRLDLAAVAVREASTELSRLLLEPIADDLAARPWLRRLALVADGELLRVPFAALPWPGDGDEPLLAHYELVALPSATTLEQLRRQVLGRQRADSELIVLADPVFSPEDPRLPDSSPATPAAPRSAAVSLRFPRLPHTRREAEALMSLVPESGRQARLGFAAGRSAVQGRGLAGYRIVHFATHALVNSAHPELSGVVLSLFDAQGHAVDGFLRLHEIYNLELDADLVVLSACRTALGESVRGEGLVGLVRGFMYAGSPRVVATLWDVDDAASADLMIRFYNNLLIRGSPPAQALREAQLEMRQSSSSDDFYDWAAFQFQGDWAGFDVDP